MGLLEFLKTDVRDFLPRRDQEVQKRYNVVDLFNDASVLNFGGQSSSGIAVNPDRALRVSAVYACVRVIAESIAQLPIHVMRETAGGMEQDKGHNLYRLLHDQPNDYQTSFEFIEMMTGHVVLRGNAYAHINRMGDGRIAELTPIHPDSVSADLDNGTMVYDVTMRDRTTRRLSQREVLHLRGLSSDGICGLSPISLAREAVGLSLATERHGATLFGNGAKPSGVLEHPGKLSTEAVERLKMQMESAYGGENSHKTAVFEEGLKWHQTTMTSDDAQFLETRKFQLNEIARIFRVPPHLIGDLERATFTNIEHQGIEFVTHTILPWVRRWEQAIQRDLMPQRNRNTHRVRFNVDGLLRGDFKTRMDGYSIALQNGIMSPNEVRRLENMNPRDGGDDYMTPMNMNTGQGAEPEPEPPGNEMTQEERGKLFAIIEKRANEAG